MTPQTHLMTSKEAAEYLRYSEYTLRRARVSKYLAGVAAPPYHKIGRTVRYKKEELDEWILSGSQKRGNLDG